MHLHGKPPALRYASVSSATTGRGAGYERIRVRLAMCWAGDLGTRIGLWDIISEDKAKAKEILWDTLP